MKAEQLDAWFAVAVDFDGDPRLLHRDDDLPYDQWENDWLWYDLEALRERVTQEERKCVIFSVSADRSFSPHVGPPSVNVEWHT